MVFLKKKRLSRGLEMLVDNKKQKILKCKNVKKEAVTFLQAGRNRFKVVLLYLRETETVKTVMMPIIWMRILNQKQNN